MVFLKKTIFILYILALYKSFLDFVRMDINGTSACAGKDEALSCVAQSVNILLVDHDTTSLMSVASQLEHQLYKGDV